MILLLAALPVFAAADSDWVLEQSTLAYHVTHPLHATDGVSHAARGKGICHANHCRFLIGVPVKSFDSGDSNRDLHMLQVTRGAEFPMVAVRTSFPESELRPGSLPLDVQIQFAGQTVNFKQVPFQLTLQDGQAHLTGTIPATLSDFKIDPPTLLTIPVKNEMPVDVDMTWKRE